MEKLINIAKRCGISGFLIFGSSMIILTLPDIPSWVITPAKITLAFGAIVLAVSAGFVIRTRGR